MGDQSPHIDETPFGEYAACEGGISKMYLPLRTIGLLLAFGACLAAHEPARPSGAAAGSAAPAVSPPPTELPYRVVPDWLRLPPGWNLEQTGGIATDARGHVYVFHRGPHPLLEFEPSGELVREIGAGLFVSAHGVEVDPEGNIWAVDVGNHTVLKFNSAGRLTMVLGRKGTAGSELGEVIQQFNKPTDIAFAPNGDIYVTDGYGNSRVVKFSPDGRLLKTWGQKGTGAGEFDTPHTIAVDAQGLVYIGDRENNRIQIFDADGKFLRQWTHIGSPWGLEITPDQHIYMADGYANRVLKLDLEGKILGALGETGRDPGQFRFVHHIAVGNNGEIYVSEILNWRLQKFVKK